MRLWVWPRERIRGCGMIISSLNSNDSIREDFRTEEPDTPGQCCGSEEEEEEGDDVSMERGREGGGGGGGEAGKF